MALGRVWSSSPRCRNWLDDCLCCSVCSKGNCFSNMSLLMLSLQANRTEQSSIIQSTCATPKFFPVTKTKVRSFINGSSSAESLSPSSVCRAWWELYTQTHSRTISLACKHSEYTHKGVLLCYFLHLFYLLSSPLLLYTHHLQLCGIMVHGVNLPLL